MKRLTSLILMTVFSFSSFANDTYLGVSYKFKNQSIVFRCTNGAQADHTITNLTQWCPEVEPVLIEGKLQKDLALSNNSTEMNVGKIHTIEKAYGRSLCTDCEHFVSIYSPREGKSVVNFPYFAKLNKNVAEQLYKRGIVKKSVSSYGRIGDGRLANTHFDTLRTFYEDSDPLLITIYAVFVLPLVAETVGRTIFDVVTLPVAVGNDIAHAFKRGKDKKNLILRYSISDQRVEGTGAKNLSDDQKIEATLNSLNVPGLHTRITSHVSKEAFEELTNLLF